MFINQKQAQALFLLASELRQPFSNKRYGYFEFEEGEDYEHFSAHTCIYSSKYSRQDDRYLFKMSKFEVSHSGTDREGTYTVENENHKIYANFGPNHPFDDFVYPIDSILFVDPDLARIVDQQVDLHAQVDLVVKKLRQFPFYLKLVLIWYASYLGFQKYKNYFKANKDDEIVDKTIYRNLVVEKNFDKWVEVIVKKIKSVL